MLHQTATTHASWLKHIELYFSFVQRKVLTPLDLPDRVAVAERIVQFQERCGRTAKSFAGSSFVELYNNICGPSPTQSRTTYEIKVLL